MRTEINRNHNTLQGAVTPILDANENKPSNQMQAANHESSSRARPVTKTQQRQCCGRLCRVNWVNITSSILLPIMFGVFTIVTTIVQSNLSEKNRQTDIDLARQQRELDARLAAELHQVTILDNFRRDIWLLVTNTDSKSITDGTRNMIKELSVDTLRELHTNERRCRVLKLLYDANLLIDREAFHFSDVVLDEINFNGAKLPNIHLHGVYLRNASFVGADLYKSNWYESQLSGANFSTSELEESTFTGAVLEKANFTHVRAYKADFHRANLAWACFVHASLEGASFIKANVTGVDFSHAFLKEAVITEEQLFIQAKSVRGATLPNGTILD